MKSKLKITILGRIAIIFSILGVLVLVANFTRYSSFEKSIRANKDVEQIYNPSVYNISEMISMVKDSKMLIQNWVFIDKVNSSPDKDKLIQIHEETYPSIKKSIIDKVEKWQEEEQFLYFDITSSIDTLFEKHQQVMDLLETFDDYNDAMKINQVIPMVSGNGDIIAHSDRILYSLDSLSTLQKRYIQNYNDILDNSLADYQRFILWMPILILVLLFVTAFSIFNSLIKPINDIKELLKQMGSGVLPNVKIKRRADEIGEMALALTQLVQGLKQTSQFALQIGDGDFETEYRPLSDKDVLGNSLLLMRQNLVDANNEAELRKIENIQRSWASQGLAEFGDLLRDSSDNLESLSNNVISKLVRYLEASIGGLFIVNNENKEDVYLELAAFYAYDRHKYIKKRVDIGENLVGQCFQENETVYLTDIPENYIHITSGLGSDNPKSILIVPLKVNQETFGVVEMASLKNIEAYQIEFVEKIGETIASAISNVKISIQTTKLLAESHEKSERLAKQEESIRQNIADMEENLHKMEYELKKEKDKALKLEKDQMANVNRYEQRLKENDEELRKYSNNLNNINLAVNNSFGLYEIDLNGYFINSNSTFLKMASLAKIEIIGKKHQQFAAKELLNSGIYDQIWSAIKNGKNYSSLNKYIFNGQTKVFYESFSPVKDLDNKINKVIVISIDESTQKRQQAY